MKCNRCLNDFPEEEIQLSHDVPCYLFTGFDRNDKKNKADNFPRHYLCKKCHKEYEEILRLHLIEIAHRFGNKYFEGINGNTN